MLSSYLRIQYKQKITWYFIILSLHFKAILKYWMFSALELHKTSRNKKTLVCCVYSVFLVSNLLCWARNCSTIQSTVFNMNFRSCGQHIWNFPMRCATSISLSEIPGLNSMLAEIPKRFTIGQRISKEGFMEPFSIFCMVLIATWHWSASSCWVSLHSNRAVRMQLPKCVAVLFGIIIHLTYILSYRFELLHSLIVPIRYI